MSSNENINYKNRNICERDMDLLYIEAFVTDHEFAELFIKQTKYNGKDFKIVSTEISKVDKNLGESDITVIFDFNGTKHALLIEDKIDAIDMPEQYRRYIKRGEQGVKNGEYSSFDVFILCPEKYHDYNEEANKYDHFVSYEECLEYFSKCKEPLCKLWYEQIAQALDTAKPENKVEINETAVASFKKYAEYQKEHYPRLKLLSKADGKSVNGWWPMFGTGDKNLYVIHKTDRNFADLTINKIGEKYAELTIIEKWLQENGNGDITLHKTGKSAAFRIETPDISMKKPFDEWNTDNLDDCFKAIQRLTDLATMFITINKIIF